MDILRYLVCPTCGKPLFRAGSSLQCEARHTFDVAKSGYVNLLPPGKGKNSRTGDDRSMVDGRMRFLRRGFYSPISDQAASLASAYLPETEEGAREEASPLFFCDMGSGEGFHTCRIAERLAALTGRPTLALGVDASKYAAERASKLARELRLTPKGGFSATKESGFPAEGETGSPGISVFFAPANLFHLPVRSHTAVAAFSLFAPVAWEEARRLLREDGVLLVVSSGRDHLFELRQILYESVRLSEEAIPAPEGFSLLERTAVRYPLLLPDPEAVASLFAMTPFFYRSPEEGRKRLLALPRLSVTVDVTCTAYRVPGKE